MTRRELFAKSLFGSLGLAGVTALGQDPKPDPKPFQGEDVFAKLLQRADAEKWVDLPIGERMGKIGMSLVETPYVAFTLELWTDREACIVNLKGLDCVTFFETSLGFARMLKKGGRTPRDLVREITLTRYRGGELGDYTSRLHYTSDWIFDNGEKGTVEVLAPKLPGSERFTKPVSFMTEKPNLYRQLKANPMLVPKIAAYERAINARETYYVPIERIDEIEPLLRTGDIVGITGKQKGIDCDHTGLCYRDDEGTLRFLHAGQSAKRVLLDKRLSEYLKGWATGAMFARPIEPEK